MKGILQITLINAFSPYYPADMNDNRQIRNDRFDRTMELIRNGVIKELHAYPQNNVDRFRQEFLDDILIDGYVDKEKMNIPLTSKSGIQYFVVDGHCEPDQATINEEIKTYKQNESNTENQEQGYPLFGRNNR